MKYILRHIKLIVCCIIILGFACVTLESHRAYKQVFDHNIRSISELGSLTIYHEIDKALSMPVAVSLSMANDSFLQAWLEEEQKRPGDAAHIRQLQNYLAGLQKNSNTIPSLLFPRPAGPIFIMKANPAKPSPRATPATHGTMAL